MKMGSAYARHEKILKVAREEADAGEGKEEQSDLRDERDEENPRLC